VKNFFDTSVLMAALLGGHIHHEPSVRLFASADAKESACSAHTLAELFATLTAIPVKPMIPPEQAVLFLEDIRQRLTAIPLASRDYFETIHDAARQGLSGGRIYDALLLRCARNCKAEIIYTWNLKHFRVLAPDLAERLQTP
jgi:predicted nucleic acid-binding protein